MRKISPLLVHIVFGLIMSFFNSCGPIHEWPTEPGKVSLGKGTKVRFVLTSPQLPPLDVYIDNQKVFSNLTFRLVTYYFDMSPGFREIKLTKASENEILFKDTLRLDSNRLNVVEILGTQTNLEVNVISRKDLSVAANNSFIRIVNSSKDLGKIDVSIYNASDNYLLTDLNYKSTSEFFRLSSGVSRINVFKSGTNQLIFTSPANLEAGKIYTIFIAGNPTSSDSSGLNAYFLDETKYDTHLLFSFEQGIARVRFINGITLTQSVQLLVDGVPLRTSLPFNQATSYQNLKAGARNIKVILPGGAGIIDTTIILQELKTYTVYLNNSSNNLNVLSIENENKNPPGNRALLRFVNSTHDLSSVVVNITSLLGQSVFELTSFRAISNYIETAPGQNIITINSSGRPNLLSLSANLEGGRVYTVFITGSIYGTERNSLMMSFTKDNDTLGHNLFTFEQVKSSIRLVNASPEIEAVDLLVDSSIVVSNLNYKYASKFIQANTGFRNLLVRLTATTTKIFESTVNIEFNKKYILFAVGRIPNADALLVETFTRAIPFGKSSVRFLNAVYDLPSVDIKIINASGTTNINQSQFKNITNYSDVDGGKNLIVVTQSGTQNVLVTAEANLDVQAQYLVVIYGLSSGSGEKKYSIGFLKENEDLYQKLPEFSAIKTKLRFLNGLYDNPKVDFYVDGTKLLADYQYRLASELISVPSGSGRNLSVTRTGTLAQIYSRISNIDYTKEYSFIVCGETNFPDGFLIENPPKSAPSGRASIRFVHGGSGLGNMAVNIVNSSGTVNIPNIQYKTASTYYDVVSGNNKITATISSTSGNIILTSDANLEEGKVYTVYILGNFVGSGEQALDIYFLIESNPGAQQLFRFAPIRSKLRFINGSTDNPILQLSVDNEFVATNVTYKNATAVLNVNSGVNRRIRVFEFGSTTPLINQDFTLSHTKSYSLLVMNKKTNLEYLFFENQERTVPAGKASVRIVHGAFDLAQVDVTFNNYTSRTRITGLGYKSVSNYLDLPSGFNEIIVTRTTSPNQLVLSIDATLEEGKIYTIYLLGNSSGNFGEEYSLNFLDETNTGGQFLFTYTPALITRLRVINASPNSSGFDVSLDQSKIVENVLFGNSSGYIFTRSGLRTVRVFPANSTSPVLLNFNFQFETNKLYSLLLMDSVSNLTPILIEDMNFTLNENKAYVRFINASSNSPPFDIKIGNPSGAIKHSYFTYQQITSYEPYDPQILSFVFTRTNSTEELVSLRGFSLVAGKAYTIVVLGFYQGITGQHLQVKWFQDN